MAIKPIEILIKAKDEASSVFGKLTGVAQAAGIAIAGYFGFRAFTNLIDGAAELEAKLSEVAAVSSATAEEMQLLRAAAEEAGASTKYTATQAADALGNLSRAGLSAKDAIAALPATLQLASAGGVGLGQAAEFITKTVSGMGLAFSDAGRIADVLAKGANASNTSVTGLAQALSYVAPIAKSSGLSLEGTVAIIGKLADGGIDASRAGTALNSILSQFADPASKFREALRGAGITTNDFEKALRQLAAAGPAGRNAILAVGLEAGPALQSLLNQGMGALDGLKKSLQDAGGSAAATAAVMENNLKGSLNGLSSAWDTVKNALGTPVLPVLKDAVDQLSASFKRAVSDGSVGRFGETIASAFQAGIRWARDFITQVDLESVTASMRDFADRANVVFQQIGEYAANAGNSAKLAYGVMSAGTNGVLTAVYGIGSVFAEVASAVMSGVSKLSDGLAKVTFGQLSRDLKAAAEDARISSGAFGAAADAMRDKAQESLDATAAAAQTARTAFGALTEGTVGLVQALAAGKPTIDQVAASIEAQGRAATAAATATEAATKSAEAKTQADVASAQALASLKAAYSQAIEQGDWQRATEIQKELRAALQGTGDAAKKTADQLSADVGDAFKNLGVTSQAVLINLAAAAKESYETIRNSGMASASDLQSAFVAYAEKAIAANAGVVPSFLQTEASIRNVGITVDESGKAIVKAMMAGTTATQTTTVAMENLTAKALAQVAAMDQLLIKYRLSADYNERQIEMLEKQNALIERADALERARIGVDKKGFATDTTGATVGQTAQTLMSIVKQLQSYGLGVEDASRIGQEFVDGNGNVPYIPSAAQKKYGGTYSTIETAVQKAAEDFLYRQGGATKSTTDPKAGTVRTVRIDLGAAGSTSIKVASDADGDALIALVRRLSIEKGRAA